MNKNICKKKKRKKIFKKINNCCKKCFALGCTFLYDRTVARSKYYCHRAAMYAIRWMMMMVSDFFSLYFFQFTSQIRSSCARGVYRGNRHVNIDDGDEDDEIYTPHIYLHETVCMYKEISSSGICSRSSFVSLNRSGRRCVCVCAFSSIIYVLLNAVWINWVFSSPNWFLSERTRETRERLNDWAIYIVHIKYIGNWLLSTITNINVCYLFGRKHFYFALVTINM